MMDGGSPGGGRWEPGGNRAILVEETPRLKAAAKAREKEGEEEMEGGIAVNDVLRRESEPSRGGDWATDGASCFDGSLSPGGMDMGALAMDLPEGSSIASVLEPLLVEDQVPEPKAVGEDEVALVLHWGLPSFNQLLPIPAGAPPPLQTPGAISAKGTVSAPPRCHFVVPSFPTALGQYVTLVGSAPELGTWNPKDGLKMTWQPGHAWVGHAHLEEKIGKGEAGVKAGSGSGSGSAGGEGSAEAAFVEAKVVFCDNGRFVWESGVNHQVDLSALRGGATDGHYTLYWGDTGTTPVVLIPRGPEVEQVEGQLMEVPEEAKSRPREENKATDVIDESGDEAQVWTGAGDCGEGAVPHSV